MKALIISADNFEDSELLVPYYRLKEAGIEVAVASLSREAIKGKHGYEVAVDKTLDEVKPDDYAILILPGGAAPALVSVRSLQGGCSWAERFKLARGQPSHRFYMLAALKQRIGWTFAKTALFEVAR